MISRTFKFRSWTISYGWKTNITLKVRKKITKYTYRPSGKWHSQNIRLQTFLKKNHTLDAKVRWETRFFLFLLLFQSTIAESSNVKRCLTASPTTWCATTSTTVPMVQMRRPHRLVKVRRTIHVLWHGHHVFSPDECVLPCDWKPLYFHGSGEKSVSANNCSSHFYSIFSIFLYRHHDGDLTGGRF